MKYSDDDIKRFWDKVDIKGPNVCWNWTASLRNGYGQFWLDYRMCRAHRVAWEISNNEIIPDDILCLHTCDNPICCNPSHLYTGSQKDNMSDKIVRDRLPKVLSDARIASIASRAKLHDYEIKEIRHLANIGKKKTWIAKEFGIGRRTLYEVLKPLYICKEGYYA